MMALESVIQCLVPFLDVLHQLVFSTVLFSAFSICFYYALQPILVEDLKIIRLWTLMGNYLVSYVVPTGS